MYRLPNFFCQRPAIPHCHFKLVRIGQHKMQTLFCLHRETGGRSKSHLEKFLIRVNTPATEVLDNLEQKNMLRVMRGLIAQCKKQRVFFDFQMFLNEFSHLLIVILKGFV